MLRWKTTGANYSPASVAITGGAISGTRITPIADTWANRASYQTTDGNLLWATDVGANGSLWQWDTTGALWYPVNGSVTLLMSSFPVGIPSSGSIGNNGALTLTTALSVIYPSAYFYFPANAIVAGSAAGFYYTAMSSTTAGIIYNNTYTSGTPTVPTPTPFVTTGPGAYTQTTGSALTIFTFTIPGGSMGLNGMLELMHSSELANNANNKTLTIKLGATSFISSNYANSARTFVGIYVMQNAASASIQLGRALSNIGSSSAVAVLGTINTASDASYTIAGTLATDTDYMFFYGTRLRLIRP